MGSNFVPKDLDMKDVKNIGPITPKMFQVSKETYLLFASKRGRKYGSTAKFLGHEIAVIGNLFQGYSCMFCYNNATNNTLNIF